MSRPLRILLAEDNAADVWLIREALSRQSLESEIENYTTAEEAIRAIQLLADQDAAVPDLIMLDYNLPAGNGSEVLAAAASNTRLRSVPKAILSSHVQPQELERLMGLGAACVISKPANLHDFLSVVGGAVRDLVKHRSAT